MPRHQILTRLARYFHVTWVDPAPHWRAAWDPRQLARRKPEPGGACPPGFHLHHSPRFLPRFHRLTPLSLITRSLRLRWAMRSAEALGARKVILYVWRPQFAYALDMFPDVLSCYHVDDEYSFSTTDRPTSEEEIRLLRRADRVIVHSPGLWEKKAGHASRPALVPNGVDFRAFADPVPEPDDLRGVPHPRIGYVGVLKRFLDVPLLLVLARRHPEWSFVFVGPVRDMGPDLEALNELHSLANVHLLGMREVHELPAYTQHMDVGIMPYDIDGYTKYIYPLKLHEYLAAGLPVVGTPIRTLQDFGSVISLARGVEDWSEALSRAVQPDAYDPALLASRRQVAAEHDWDVIAHRVAAVLAEDLPATAQRAIESSAPTPLGR